MQNKHLKNVPALRGIGKVFNDWLKKLKPIEQPPQKNKTGNQNLGADNNTTLSKSDAVFLAWQETPKGEVFALYNVTSKKHPLYGSTVTEETLRKEHLNIPPTPNPPGSHKRHDFEK